MIIKWTDLEVGDVIRVTDKIKKEYKGSDWTNKDLVVSNISVRDDIYGGGQTVCIHCDNHHYYFEINSETGCYKSYEYLGQFFNIINLGDND